MTFPASNRAERKDGRANAGRKERMNAPAPQGWKKQTFPTFELSVCVYAERATPSAASPNLYYGFPKLWQVLAIGQSDGKGAAKAI